MNLFDDVSGREPVGVDCNRPNSLAFRTSTVRKTDRSKAGTHMARKKEEANDIVQFLRPALEKVGIATENCKFDTRTDKTGRNRGDVWVSRQKQPSATFEKDIIALIEAKHCNCDLGDMDWRDAMAHGKSKAQTQGLTYYAVTNCRLTYRFYNAITDDEIRVDGKVLTSLQPMDVLEKMLTQVSADNSHVVHKTIKEVVPVSESKFRNALKELADVYRSCGLKKGDERIDPSVGFVVLKYIGEKEQDRRSLKKAVRIWPDFGEGKGNFKADFESCRDDVFSGDNGDTYMDFKELVSFPKKLKNEHYERIYKILNDFHFHGCSFDVFGAIYEEFASQTKKKEFGEFYTRRHITGVIARLLLRNEINPRALKLCDPACGTGGFLTEGYKSLVSNYASHGKMNATTKSRLESEVFWGYDNDDKSVSRAQLNMFLVGDGHTHIRHIPDSLTP